MRQSKAFTVHDTHGILWRPEHRIESSSDGLGWSSLYVSMQQEQPYQDSYPGTQDHLIIVHRDGPVRVNRDLSGDRAERVVQPGGLFIMPRRRDFGVRLGGPLSTIHIYVSAAIVQQAAAELVSGDSERVELIPRLGEHDGMIEQLAHTACQLMRDRASGEWLADSLARVLAVQLVSRHSTARLAAVAAGMGLSKRKLESVDAFMRAHIGDSVALSDMAHVAALSPIHFARQFKKATGHSPHQYLLRLRVEGAKRLLRTGLPIADIAVRCGFSHQEHLTRVFGRLVGVTPALFRRAIL